MTRDNKNMAADPIEGMHARSRAALAAAFVMLAGAAVAFAVKAHIAAIVLLAVMLACAMASFVFAVIFRNRAVAMARASRAAGAREQQRKARR